MGYWIMNFFREHRRIIVAVIVVTFLFWMIIPIVFALLRGL